MRAKKEVELAAGVGEFGDFEQATNSIYRDEVIAKKLERIATLLKPLQGSSAAGSPKRVSGKTRGSRNLKELVHAPRESIAASKIQEALH